MYFIPYPRSLTWRLSIAPTKSDTGYLQLQIHPFSFEFVGFMVVGPTLLPLRVKTKNSRTSTLSRHVGMYYRHQPQWLFFGSLSPALRGSFPLIRIKRNRSISSFRMVLVLLMTLSPSLYQSQWKQYWSWCGTR